MSRSQSGISGAVSTDSLDWLEPDPTLPQAQRASVHALELDRMLWRGFHDFALPRLRALLERGPPVEKAAAGWVLARWEVDQHNLQRAYQAILAFHAHREGGWAVPHLGPYLLAVQLGAVCDDARRADEILQSGIERFGESPDFTLARLSLAKAHGASDRDLSTILNELHAGSGLAAISLSGGDIGLFDRLLAEPIADAEERLASLPLISVIVPVFNGVKVLPTALRGLRSQSWPNLEILLVDDGSTDQTLALTQNAAAQDPRIKIIALGANQGAYTARNEGFAQARGTFVTVHDADDWSHPQKIERQARALMDNPALKASVSHWVRVDDGLAMTRWRIEEGWVYRNVSSLMIRASLRDEIGYWDRTRVNADTEYYYRLLHAYGAGAIVEVCPGSPLAFGRTQPESLTNRSLTHMRTQYSGIRHDYMEAAHAWHARASRPADLYLPQHPTQRPFPAPAAIALDSSDAEPDDHTALARSDLLDADWYLLAYPDVMQSDLGAARHYLAAGAGENRDPGPCFSTSGYRHAQGLSTGENPLLHFLRVGQAQGAVGLPTFKGKLEPTTPGARCVLVFTHTSGETLFGAERSLLDVVKRLAHDGLCPVVVLPTIRNVAYLNALLEISSAVETLPQIWRNGLYPPSSKTVDAARALIRKYRPAEVHVNTVALEAPLIAARAEAASSVVYVREMPAEDPDLCRALGMAAEALRDQLLEQADRFIMPSQVVADWLACPDRCTVRPNAVDETLFDLAFTPGPVLKVALISSNIAKKGIKDVVAAARIVAATGWPVHFLLIGPQTGDLDLLHPLPPNVIIRNYVATPAEAIGQADIVLSLSHFAESFGRTVVEAMAAGRPVICYDRGAPPSLIISGKTGFVVPADSPEGVADAVLALDVARLQLERMSHAARVRAREIQDQALA